jgi:carboxypeptidase C (cathepsin A)
MCITLIFLFFLSCTAGCTSVRIGDTHNVSVAVQSYNSWVSDQKALDSDVRKTISQVGEHVNTYNSEIAKDSPDIALLRENLAQDRQLLSQWGTRLDTLNAATDRFEQETADITYDDSSVVRVHATLDMMTQYMKIYSVNMGNARQYLIEYVNNAEAYISPEDPDYWNDNYRQTALQVKQQASASLADWDAALGNITSQALELEKMQ